MADIQTPQSTSTGTGNVKNGASRDAMEAARKAVDTAADQARQGARATEAVTEKTAEATRDASRASAEILRTQFATAEQALRTGVESSARGLEGLTQGLTRVFGVTGPNPELAARSAENVRAVSEASTALAKGAQETSRSLFELAQKTMTSNVEAFSRFAGCRSAHEVIALQSELLRTNLQQLIESSEAMARASTDAIHSAARAIAAPSAPQAR